MSEATLISVVPFPIAEFKPGIYPGFFEIPACNRGVPEILVIRDSVYHVEIDENRTITVKCPAEDIAKSVVNDYITSNLEYNTEDDSAPGFFFKPGRLDLGLVLAKFEKDLIYHKDRQNRWFQRLVKLADDDWEKTRQHRAISDIQRYAAKSLNLIRPWIITPVPVSNEQLIKCGACQSSIDSKAVICPHCKCILNMEQYKKFQFAVEK